ncbi:glutaminase [Aliikangiella maris]|uniref:Glutaminase n=2 Tax=Aliikangiella maris TaxID=3162458 RepID=A0ABV3MNV2_9GAMM
MVDINYQDTLTDIYTRLLKKDNYGEPSEAFPVLSDVDTKKFGIHMTTIESENFSIGDANDRFSIQSISKVLSLTYALNLVGEKIWQRVRIEPSGSAFNSLVQLEYEKGIPRNPFINAGAIVICDILVSALSNPKQEMLNFIRSISGNENIDYCKATAEEEEKFAFRNYALANFMKSFGNIENKISQVLELYFYLCSINLSCQELSHTFLYLANNGVSPLTNLTVATPSQTKKINAIMQMCGLYDEAGEFAYRVGLPGKSGIGGGIVAVHPGKYVVTVWSPKLNKKGNSYRGINFLEIMTTETEISIF